MEDVNMLMVVLIALYAPVKVKILEHGLTSRSNDSRCILSRIMS